MATERLHCHAAQSWMEPRDIGHGAGGAQCKSWKSVEPKYLCFPGFYRHFCVCPVRRAELNCTRCVIYCTHGTSAAEFSVEKAWTKEDTQTGWTPTDLRGEKYCWRIWSRKCLLFFLLQTYKVCPDFFLREKANQTGDRNRTKSGSVSGTSVETSFQIHAAWGKLDICVWHVCVVHCGGLEVIRSNLIMLRKWRPWRFLWVWPGFMKSDWVVVIVVTVRRSNSRFEKAVVSLSLVLELNCIEFWIAVIFFCVRARACARSDFWMPARFKHTWTPLTLLPAYIEFKWPNGNILGSVILIDEEICTYSSLKVTQKKGPFSHSRHNLLTSNRQNLQNSNSVNQMSKPLLTCRTATEGDAAYWRCSLSSVCDSFEDVKGLSFRCP